MAGTNSIPGSGSPIGYGGVARPGVQQKPAAKGSFAETLKGYVGSVNGDQQNAGQAIQDLVAGKSQDVLPVVTAVAKADMSFKLLVGVRNKVIEAYKQTLNMQV